MRRRQKEVGGSLDSLLDTMTNVVGILIILLIVTQLNVGEKVKEIRENLPDISIEELQSIKEKVDLQKKQLTQLQEAIEDPKEMKEVDPVKLEQLKKQLAELQKLLSKPIKEIKLSNLSQEDLKKEKEKLEKLKEKIESELKELEKLTAQLVDIPLPLPGPPAKVVKMPDPRSAPKGAKALKFLCTNEKVYPIEFEKIQKSFSSVFRVSHFKKSKEGKYLKDSIIKYFNEKVKGDSYFNIRMNHLKYSYNAPYFKLEAKETKGFTLSQLKKRNSTFESKLKKAARENKASLKKDQHEKWYISFIVAGDSFESYLAARDIAEKNGFAVGWKPTGWNGYMMERHGLKLEFDDLIKPKPAPKTIKKVTPTGKKPVDQID